MIEGVCTCDIGVHDCEGTDTTAPLSTTPQLDIDYCNGIDCGGPSICTNGIGKYTCECAEDWFGGGVNKTCETAQCACTGHQGYWKAGSTVVDGQLKGSYDHGETYGESCAAHDEDPTKPEDVWRLERWYANRLAVRPTMR